MSVIFVLLCCLSFHSSLCSEEKGDQGKEVPLLGKVLAPVPVEAGNGQAAGIEYSEIVTNFQYTVVVYIFGEEYVLNVGFSGQINGQMQLTVSKRTKDGGSAKVIADLGGEMGRHGKNKKKKGSGVPEALDLQKNPANAQHLSDILRDYVHNAVTELTDKAVEKSDKEGGEKLPFGDPHLTEAIAQKIVADLGKSEFAEQFAKLQYERREKGEGGGILSRAMRYATKRMTPFALGPMTIRLNLMQDMVMNNSVFTRLNAQFDLEAGAKGEHTTMFKLITETWKENDPEKVGVVFQVDGKGAQKMQVTKVVSNGEVRQMNPLQMAQFLVTNFVTKNAVMVGARKFVVTAATPIIVGQLGQKVIVPALFGGAHMMFKAITHMK